MGWALMGRALMNFSLAGPLWAPIGPPWALMGQALMGRSIMGLPGPLWAGPL